MSVTQDNAAEDPQRVIAALRRQLDEREAERDALLADKSALTETLARQNERYREQIDQQGATIDVLRAMSASPGDPQPAFDLIATRARDLCGAYCVSVHEYDGTQIWLRSVTGVSDDQQVLAAYKALYPRPATRETPSGLAILDRRVVRVDDVPINASPDGTVKSVVVVPAIRGAAVIGAISMVSRDVGAFSDTQIELLKAFAEQAVIAITSAETYRALQARTAELAARNDAFAERMDHQAATIDVLKVMSASPGDPQPVFDLIVRQAQVLCGSRNAALFEYDGTMAHLRARVYTGDWTEADEAFRRRFPRPITRDTDLAINTAILEGRIVHTRDADQDPGIPPDARAAGIRAGVMIPIMRDGRAVGTIGLTDQEPGGFSDTQIELLKTFAEQAVIAITSAETYRALQTRTADLQESLEYQTATSDVLKVISRSTFDLQPVLDAVAETAARLCNADQAAITRFNGGLFRFAANFGFPPAYEAAVKDFGAFPAPPDSPTVSSRCIREGRLVHVLDVAAEPGYPSVPIELGKQRTSLGVPLLRDGEAIGVILLARQRVEPFTERQIELVRTFADQAVIAIENTRLMTEQREALEQQTATAEVLRVINASPGDLTPVFEVILEKAHRICRFDHGALALFDGTHFRSVATRGYSEVGDAISRAPYRPAGAQRLVLRGARFGHIPDIPAFTADPDDTAFTNFVAATGFRATLLVPLLKDGAVVGHISGWRLEAGPFSDKEIALLENFAAQAVIAMENARLLNEIRQHQEELRITFENMGDGVAMFDGEPRLVAWNAKFQEIFAVPSELLEQRRTYADYIRFLAQRGDYGPDADVEQQVRRITGNVGRRSVYERLRPDGRAIEIRNNPVDGGGFVLIFSDITERKRNEAAIAAARDAAEAATRTIEAAYRDLKIAQANLVQAEKMASLGQLTAGIAHEIKNPLNFVNNFAALSVDLLEELQDAAEPGFATLTDDQRADVDDVSAMLTMNLQKIVEHGKRADGIVKAMLEHSRGSSGERREVDLNALVDEALNLAYHGARAQDQGFNISLERDYADGIAPIEVNPQDLTRVFLNLFSNGFYAANKRATEAGEAGYHSTLRVSTADYGDSVAIRIRDNGTGIRPDIRDKLFEPFFTTKPTGEGTGLGLSITYDIVTKQHGGTIAVDSEVGVFTEFVVTLPREMFGGEGARP